MTDVKNMSAKDDFIEMPFTDRGCEIEAYEECRTRKLLEASKCVPWEMPGFQVDFLDPKINLSQFFIFSSWVLKIP